MAMVLKPAPNNSSHLAPVLTGVITWNDFLSVRDYYNNNFPSFNFNYDPGIEPWSAITAGLYNNFCSALGACNDGWKGVTALPDITSYATSGPQKDVITEIVFKYPKANFSPIIGKEYFASGNNTSDNSFTVPPGCNYVHIDWLMAGGGAGGGAGKGAPFVTPQGGGAGAYINDVWIKVKVGDVLTYTIGDKGIGSNRNAGTSGGNTFLTIYRPSTGQTFVPFNVSGGYGGSAAWLLGIEGTYDTNGAGGKLISTFGYTGYNGSRSDWGWITSGHGGSGGRDGGPSPLGQYGSGEGNNIDGGDASGYGAGGGSTGFYQGKHWSGDSDDHRGGNGAPGYGKVNYLLTAPDGVDIHDITDTTTSVSISYLGPVTDDSVFNYGSGAYEFVIPNNVNYLQVIYAASPSTAINRSRQGASGSYIQNSVLDIRNLSKPCIMTIQASSGAPYNDSSFNGVFILSLNGKTEYNLKGAASVGERDLTTGTILYSVDPNNSHNGTIYGWDGVVGNPGSVNDYGNVVNVRRGVGNQGGISFKLISSPNNLPSNALAVKLNS